MKKSLIIALAMVVGSFAMPAFSTYALEEGPASGVDCSIYPEDPSCVPEEGSGEEGPGENESEPEEPSTTDPYTENFQLSTFASAISAMLPVVGVAVLVGFLFYVIRWAIGLFRGI